MPIIAYFCPECCLTMMHADKFGIVPATDDINRLFPKNRLQRTRIGSVCFLLVLQGNALVEIDRHDLLLRKGSFLFLLPNMLLQGLSHTDDFRFEYLYFDFEYLADFPLLLKADISDKATNAPCRRLDEETYVLVMQYFDFIGRRHNSFAHSEEITKGLLFSFIMEVSRIYSDRVVTVEVSRRNELVDNFFRLLHIYYKEEHTAAFYADRLCVSDKHLMRTVKAVTDKTVHFWLANFLIREAKLQLRSTDKSITRIAEELHFPNSSFFARFFRRHVGMSPLRYRK